MKLLYLIFIILLFRYICSKNKISVIVDDNKNINFLIKNKWSILKEDIKCYTKERIPVYFSYISFNVRIHNSYIINKELTTNYQYHANNIFNIDFDNMMNTICSKYTNIYDDKTYINYNKYIFYYNFLEQFTDDLKEEIQKKYIYYNIDDIRISYNSLKGIVSINNSTNILLFNSSFDKYIYKIKFTDYITRVYYML